MKLSIKAFLIILVGLLIVGSFLIILGRFTTSGKSTALVLRRPVVYIDVKKLVVYHPGFENLKMIDKVLGALERTPQTFLTSMKNKQIEPIEFLPLLDYSKQRNVLESKALWVSVQALENWKESQREALKARLKINRQAMMDTAQAEVNMQVRDIRTAEAEKIRNIDERDIADRLNAKLKASTLSIASKSDPLLKDVLKDKLEAALINLNDSEQAYTAEVKGVSSQAQTMADDLNFRTTRRVAASLSVYEVGETKRIENRLSAVRDEMINELAAGGTNKKSCGIVELNGLMLSDILPGQKLKSGINKSNVTPQYRELLKARALMLEKFELDIKVAVEKIAKQKGLIVTYLRSTPHKSDSTDEFAKVLKNDVWQYCTPVLCNTGGF